MSKKKYIIINIILAVIVLAGGTYAFYEWQSSNNTDVTLSVDGLKVIFNGGTDITEEEIIPTNIKDEGISKTIEVQLDSDKTLTPTPTLNLSLNLTRFSSLLKDPSFKWELYKGNDLINNGNFSENNQGDKIILTSNQNITNTKDIYTLYLWIDGNMDNNILMQNQPFTFELSATGTNSLLGELVNIDGRLLLSNGEPCEECDLTIYSDPIETTTDSQGNYHLTNVPVGNHTIIASINGTELLNDSLEIKTGNSLSYNNKVLTTNITQFRMDITIANDKTLGTVVASNGKTTMAEDLINLATTNTNELMTIVQPATTQVNHQTTEYRYFGVTPNNYVYYNCLDNDASENAYGTSNYDYATSCEKWRVIGVFETETPIYTNQDITSYKTENRVKIIRDESIGEYSWDSSESDVNNGWGANAWREADIMTTLNSGPYWNKTSGTCFTGYNNKTATCDFSDSGLNEAAKNLISEAKYYLGGHTTSGATTSTFYNAERGTAVRDCSSGGKYCTDTADRSEPYWTGSIGLMYPSDYGYAAGSTCANGTNLRSYNSNCKNIDWLYNSSITQWTMTPYLYSTTADDVFYVYSDGYASDDYAYYGNGVRPVVYLSSNVMIKGGSGTNNSPWIINK